MLIDKTPQIDLFSHPIFKRLTDEFKFEITDPSNFEAVISQSGLTMLLFIEDPNRMKETMDALVIAPELAKSCALIKNKAVVVPPHARKLALAYGFKRWPALVFLKDGGYLGAVDGLRLWSDLVKEVDRILQSSPSFPPSIGIPVTSA